ncbi:hypothetical protein EGW08_003692 [Elysia chlorotica]|uniref:Conserved oligomeric Golgi complex subunit 1 n=1 Tax=Elysia chlorotica TaxID=188477 RepID=A0A3S1ACR1_ELYCH|nr:hypothetical protein EGW08_003692 [Elysia chlorotica]
MYKDFLKPLFLDRVQTLIQYQLETTAELMKRTISKAMMELTSDMNDSTMQCERNLASFVWTESPADIVMADIWQAASSKTLMDCGGLMLKARAFTPAVQNLCHSVDEKLRLLLEDTESYVQAAESEPRQDSDVFDRFADTPDILKFMQQSGVKCVQEILSYLTEQLHLWEKSLTDIPDPITSAITENKVLLTARTCAAMSEMTPHLQRCILALPDWNKHASFKLTKKFRSQKPSELPEWNSIHMKLQQCQMTAYRIWMEYTYKQIMSGFSEQISSVDQNAILTSLTRWEEVQITEEAEEGKKFSSKIFVPVQASWHLQTLLYRLCDDLNKIGIQALPRSVVQNLLVKVTDGLITAYEELLALRGHHKCTNPLSQPEVLQELFNFRFIQLIIPRKGEEEIHKKYQQRCQTVLSQLEDIVDPFDLDVFSPYIQANLSKQAQRSSVIFGALCHLDKLGGAGAGSVGGSLSGGLRPLLSGQEPHNVLSLISCPNRFPLLPLGSQHGSRGGGNSALTTQPLKAQTMSRTADGNGPSLTSMVESTLPSSSSQADLSSSFYDKMEKLGSMGSRIFSNISGKS